MRSSETETEGVKSTVTTSGVLGDPVVVVVLFILPTGFP